MMHWHVLWITLLRQAEHGFSRLIVRDFEQNADDFAHHHAKDTL
jgi:hypothetical protein